MQLIILVQYNDYTYQVIRCSSNADATDHIERLKKNSSVLTVELINAQTLSYWDNPDHPLNFPLNGWIDETEL